VKIDLNMKFREVDGKTIPELVVIEDKEGVRKVDPLGNFFMKRGRDLTLKIACLNVLTNPPLEVDDRGNSRELRGETKLAYAEFAQRIYKADGLFEMSAREIVLLTRLIDKTYRSPLIYAQALETLDPHAAKEEERKREEARKKEMAKQPPNGPSEQKRQ